MKSNSLLIIMGAALMVSLSLNIISCGDNGENLSADSCKVLKAMLDSCCRSFAKDEDSAVCHTLLANTPEESVNEGNAMITRLERTGVRISNRPIFICKENIENIQQTNSGYAGIWVRRGLGTNGNVHDIIWAATSKDNDAMSATTPPYYTWCMCMPCCSNY